MVAPCHSEQHVFDQPLHVPCRDHPEGGGQPARCTIARQHDLRPVAGVVGPPETVAASHPTEGPDGLGPRDRMTTVRACCACDGIETRRRDRWQGWCKRLLPRVFYHDFFKNDTSAHRIAHLLSSNYRNLRVSGENIFFPEAWVSGRCFGSRTGNEY